MQRFNLSRYQELLIKIDSVEKEFKEKNQTKDFFKNPIFLELINLKCSVERQIVYDQKSKYFDLIQKYLDETIHAYEFRAEFQYMIEKDAKKSRKILKNFDDLSNFWINLKSDEFYSLFQIIEETCQYAFEFYLDEENAMSEDEFYDSIKDTFLKMRKYLNEE